MVEARASTRRSARGMAVRSAWLALAVALCLALSAPPTANAAVAQGGHRARAEAAPRSEIDVLARSVGETLARASRSRVSGDAEAPTTAARGARPRRRELLLHEEGEQPPLYAPPPRFYSPGSPEHEDHYWQDHGDEAGGDGGSTSCQADGAGTLWSVGGVPIADIGSVYNFRAGRYEHTVSVHGQLEVNGQVRVRRMGVRECFCACSLLLALFARACARARARARVRI